MKKEKLIVWVPVGLDLLGLLISVGVIIKLLLTDGDIDDSIILSIILTFFTYFFIANVISKFSFRKHENSLITKTDNLIHHIYNLADKIESENIKIVESFSWSNDIRQEYIYYLELLSPIMKDKFNSMFSGEFTLSSDVFKDYYLGLLKKPIVKFYYSTAIVDDEKYFERNNIEDLKNEYNIIANKNTRVVLLYILNDERRYDKRIKEDMIHNYQKLQNFVSKNNNITLLLGFTSNFDSEEDDEENWKKDIGIAGDIACAEMSSDSKQERYKFIFNPIIRDKYEKLFDFQKDVLERNQKINLAKLNITTNGHV